MPVVDFSDVVELEAVEEGTYRSIIADFSREKGQKADYYKVKFTIQDEKNEEANGRSLFRNYSLSTASLWALKRFMLAAGTEPEKFAGSLDTDEEMMALKGAEVDVTVIQKDFTKGDETRVVNEVTKVESPGF